MVKTKEENNLILKQDLENKEKQLEEQLKINNENNSIKNEINQINKKMHEIELNDQDLKNQIIILKGEKNKKDEIIKEKNDKFKNLEKKYSDIENILKEKEKNIESLLIEKNEQKEKLKQKEEEIKNIKNLQKKKEEELNKKLNDIINKEQKLNKDNIALRNKIKEYEKELKERRIEFEKITKMNQNENNNNNINNNINNLNSLNNFYPKPLINIEDTNYLNPILQCLSQTKALTKYFLNNQNKIFINNINNIINYNNAFPLSYSYFQILKKLWEKNGTESVNPQNFKTILEKCQYNTSKFSQFLIINILNQFHSELKRYKDKIAIDKPYNPYDENNSLFYFLNENFNEVSIISDIFFGISQTTNECDNCKTKCYNYEKFNSLIFQLEKVKSNNNSNIITIFDCINYYQKRNSSNKIYCNYCKSINNSTYTTKIYSSPNVLILIINTDKENINKIKLDIKEKIDITNYVYQKEFLKIVYSLYGVISMITENNLNPYYVASCKNPVDLEWYRYKDINIMHINNIQKDVIEYGTPFMLFYKKVKSF